MKSASLKFLAWVLFFLAISCPVFAIYWTLVDPSAIPYDRREVAPAAFNGYFYVASATAPLNSGIFPTRVFRSADGLSWTLANNFGNNIQITQLIANGQNLYAFVDDRLGAYHVYRSADGLTWTDVYTGMGNSYFMPLVSFGGFIYQFDSSAGFTIRKSDGLGNPLTWQIVSQGPGTITPNFPVKATEFQNEVYVLSYSGSGPTYDINIFKSPDLGNWTLSKLIPNNIPRPSLAACSSGLYSGLGDVWRLPSSTETWAIDLAGPLNGTIYPMKVFGHTLAFRPGPTQGNPQTSQDDLLVRSSSGSWSIDSTCQGIGAPTFETLPISIADIAYIPACTSARIFKDGLVSLARKTFILPTLSFDQRDATLSAMTLTINLDETLTSFVVENLGSARATTDIKRLQLLRSRFVASVETFTTVCELAADSDTKTWRMPNGTQVSLQDQDNLYVTADIASFPTNLATVQLSVTSMGWARNISYTPPLPLVAPQSIAINGNPSAPTTISDVLPSPQPASNQVKFFYDLNSMADVHIKIFNVTGELVSQVSDTGKAAGRNSSIWDSTKVASGVYYATVEIIEQSGGTRRYRKTVYIKK